MLVSNYRDISETQVFEIESIIVRHPEQSKKQQQC